MQQQKIGFFLVLLALMSSQSAKATWLELGQKLDEEEKRIRGPDYDPDIVYLPSEDIKLSLDCSVVNMTSTQLELCRKAERGLLVAIAQGINAAVYKCRLDMKNRQWNCPVSGGSSLFGKALTAGTRETAYVHGMLSVAVTYSIVIACADGSLRLTCGCLSRAKLPPFNNKTYEWGQCTHDVEKGAEIASSFIEAGEEEETNRLRHLMNLHNYNAGKKVATTGVKLICRCIGGTLSCPSKVCHREVREFAYMGRKLMEMYQGAVQVRMSKNNERLKNADSTATFNDADFAYANASSLCEPNPNLGYAGIHGRECSLTKTADNYCPTFCCGYGYTTYTEQEEYSCKCSLRCCFWLACKLCTRDVVKHRCR